MENIKHMEKLFYQTLQKCLQNVYTPGLYKGVFEISTYSSGDGQESVIAD